MQIYDHIVDVDEVLTEKDIYRASPTNLVMTSICKRSTQQTYQIADQLLVVYITTWIAGFKCEKLNLHTPATPCS